MSLPWFRMYADFLTDWRIESLSFEDQRHYTFLLCMKCAGILDADYPNPDIRERTIARKLGIHGEALEHAKRRLMEIELIDDQWFPIAWEKRQLSSDNSADRMRKYRERKKTLENKDHPNSIDPSPLRNCSVPDIDTELELDLDHSIVQPKEPEYRITPPSAKITFETFWETYPRKVAKAAALKAWAKLKPDPALLQTILDALAKQSKLPKWQEAGGEFIPHAATWLNNRRWEDEIAASVPLYLKPMPPGDARVWRDVQ